MPHPDLPYLPEIPRIEVFVNGINTFNRQNVALLALSFSSE